jgi:galactofuranosylgalactofuranosylrhamnosyl-N-acetylglucosaminyl-diphospho-decaprenol beta-1,5/1,6-galactofuranosyltransferase
MRFKICNVLTKPEPFLADHLGMYWDDSQGSAAWDESAGALALTGTVDFTTFLNSLSVLKWQRYTGIGEYWLHVELSGAPCRVMGTSLASSGPGLIVEPHPLAAFEGSPEGEPQAFDMRLPLFGAELSGFELACEGRTLLHAALYYVEADEGRIRPVELALVTTTFRNEDYITRNVEAVRAEVLGCDDPIAEHFRMIVVDNGRTLEASLAGDGVELIGNPNVGGSGGFARGMMAALDEGATHVLLMDDDVRVLPESFKRTFSLLSLARGRYQDAFVNGAMLKLQKPNIQEEDVSRVLTTGAYRRIKPVMDMSSGRMVAHSEAFNVEYNRAYGAWWFSCIPASVIREHGLPLPVFVRCDDVEYGMRCKPVYMAMNGICVWHSMFEGRFRASVDQYQYQRNFMIMNAVDSLDLDAQILIRFNRTFSLFLRAMAYDICDLMLDGLADYLKGPEFLEHADAAGLFREMGARNERLVPLDELDEADARDAAAAPPDFYFLKDGFHFNKLAKLIDFLPIDTHLMPETLLTDEPAATYFASGPYPMWRTLGHTTLVSYDDDGTAAAVRHMDRTRFQELTRRLRRLMRAYRDRNEEVSAEWRAALPWLSSREFWESYLAEQDAYARDEG